MKAITAVCATGASVPAIANGRISRHRDGENAEIQMYLSKLKDLVPFMPKNRKLSKLEIIQHVIDYICDLQSELETHPAVNNFDAAAALNGGHNNNQQDQQQQISSSAAEQQQQQLNIHQISNNSTTSSPRQPLCVRPSPNTILTNYNNNIFNSNNNINATNQMMYYHQTTQGTETTNPHTTVEKFHHRSQH